MKALRSAPMIRRIIAVAGLIACADAVWAQPRVTGVALATGVSDLKPVGQFEPLAVCSTERPSSVPRIVASQQSKVFVWTNIESSVSDTIRHEYYMNDARLQLKETSYHWRDRLLNFIDSIDVNIGRLATVTLKVERGSRWRIWSSKDIDSGVHNGTWRVEIKTVHTNDEPLCTLHFDVVP